MLFSAAPGSKLLAEQVLNSSSNQTPSCDRLPLPATALRPRFRWWWPGGYINPDQVEKEIHAMADAGFGGFEIADVRDGISVPMDPKVYGWGGERWRAGVERALETAALRGLKADITLGAHWPTGMPGVTPDDPAAAKELVFGSVKLGPGETHSGPTPRSNSKPSGLHMHLKTPTVTPELIALQAYRQVGEESGSFVLDPKSRIDLMKDVKGETITWQAPADGTWHLMGFWMRGTAQTQNMFDRAIETSMLADPVPCAVDVYGKAGTQVCIDYWENHLLPPRTRELLRQIGGNFFEDSLELKAIKHWSPDLPQEFKAMRGYDIYGYLPLLAENEERGPVWGPDAKQPPPPFTLAGVDRARFNDDFQHTLTEMYALNRVKALSEWAATLGMGLRAQCSGLAAAYCTVPEGDNGDTMDSFSAKAAARDIAGRTILSDEAATFVGGQAYVADWKLLLFMLQRDFAGGVNQVVLHGFSYADAPGASWPGFSAFGFAIGNDWGPRSPLWAHASDIAGYLGRLQAVLQSGKSQADVVILERTNRTDVAFNSGRDGSEFGEQLRLAGYTRQHIEADLLSHPNVKVSDGVLTPDGAGYRAMIVMPAEERSPETVNKLIQFARAGLPVVVIDNQPKSVPGLNSQTKRERLLKKTWKKLVKANGVKVVANKEDALAALADLAVPPSLGYSQKARIMPVLRRHEQGNDYYLLNDSDAAVSVEVSLLGSGIPVIYNLWTGEESVAPVFKSDANRITLPIDFKPNEVVVIRRRQTEQVCNYQSGNYLISGEKSCRIGEKLGVKAETPGRFSAVAASGKTVEAEAEKVRQPIALSQWHLTVEDWRPGDTAASVKKIKHDLNLKRLSAWNDLKELRGVSGIGHYTTDFKLEKDWRESDGAYLDLGQVGGSFRVTVNGHQLPPCNQFTNRIDISDFVQAGQNLLEIEIATTLNNQLESLGVSSSFGLPGMTMPTAKFSNSWQPPADADPLAPPKGEYLGAPMQEDAPGPGPRMAPGAGNPGGKRSVKAYGLIGPVKITPYTVAYFDLQ